MKETARRRHIRWILGGGVLNGCGPVTGEPPELGREVEAKGVSRASWLGPCKQREMKGKRR